MQLDFRGEVFEWRGPAPYFFIAVPVQESAEIAAVAAMVTYGWGVIPVTCTIGDTTWETSLFPKDGGYLVPVKAWVRRAEALDEGETVLLRLAVPA